MKPEAELLLAWSSGAVEALRRCAFDPVDAQRFCELAGKHQVDALCHWQGRRLGKEAPEILAALPDSTKDFLKSAFAHHSLRNEQLVRDIEAVQRALAARGIEALVFKGPWVAFEAYPEPGLRHVDDIDLGVRAQDYRGALEALREVGYRALGVLPDAPDDALRHAHYRQQLRFLAPGRRQLELHFRMVNFGPPRSDERWVWETKRAMTLGRVEVHVPGPEAMLLHVALHANQHGFGVLRLLYDVRFALERLRPELDEEAFVARVEALRCGPAVFHALALATELAGAPDSSSIQDVLSPSAARRRVYARLWALARVRRLEAPQRANALEASRFYVLEMGTLADKLRYVRDVVRAAGGVRPFLRAARLARARK